MVTTQAIQTTLQEYSGPPKGAQVAWQLLGRWVNKRFLARGGLTPTSRIRLVAEGGHQFLEIRSRP